MAPFYDLLESGAEATRFCGWRAELWERVREPRVLELGVGTGKNFPFYQHDLGVIAVDVTSAMLDRARARATR